MGRRRAAEYLVAILSPVIAVLVRLALQPLLEERFPFATLFLAVVVSAYVGGTRPAVLAAVLGVVGAVLLLPGPEQRAFYATGVGRAGLVLYVAVSLGIAALGGAMHRAKRRAQDAQHALRAHDRRKNEFIATLAHELRNPLASIQMSVALLQELVDEADAKKSVGIIDRQTRQIERLIEDLFDVTRIALGKIVLKKQVCDLRELVCRSIEATRPQVAAREHELDAHLPEEPIAVDADPARMQQVFGNLLSNAARYTPPGGKISVRTKCWPSSVSVSVCDTGVGIEASHKAEIFEPFVQLSAGKTGGLGIGLALVKTLVELHGGGVEVRSGGAGKGAEFVVTLPVDSRPIDGQP